MKRLLMISALLIAADQPPKETGTAAPRETEAAVTVDKGTESTERTPGSEAAAVEPAKDADTQGHDGAAAVFNYTGDDSVKLIRPAQVWDQKQPIGFADEGSTFRLIGSRSNGKELWHYVEFIEGPGQRGFIRASDCETSSGGPRRAVSPPITSRRTSARRGFFC